MNPQSVRVALELQAGQNLVVLAQNENEAKELADSLKEVVAPGNIVAAGFADSYSQLVTSTVDVVLIRGSAPLNLLFEAFRVLKSGSTLACYETLEGRTFEQSEALNKNLTVAGFIDSHVESEGKLARVISKKPTWEVGAVQGIKKKTPAAKPTWTVEGLEDDVLMDEKDLLSEADLAAPDLSAAGCGTVTKKACKNCTCGLAEEQNAPKQKLTLEMIENPGVNSSCGNCALGDAFRCAGCPYKGLPAFTPGQKIELPDDFNIDDL